ncbi:MAG: hypothetical protein FJY83_09035, partial [Candidatus Aminicenantes bacterium]|nr:hypothetical protein [Candidatus Aminicenantes bacterium]
MPHFMTPKGRGIRLVLSGLVVLFLAGHLGTQTALTPGRVVGDISFIIVTPETAGYLAANPAAPWTSTDPYTHPVRLYHVLNSSRSAASAYIPVNAAPDGQTYLAANFDINPSVGPGRRDFVLEINPLKFSNGAKYIFGSREPLSPFYRLCLNVQSLTDDPDGTRCDISECAVLLPLRLRFGGTEENKNAIDDAYPAVCRATAYVKENPGSEDLVLQAESETKQLSVDSLKTAEGVILPILMRASGSVMWIRVECEVKIKEGESGFPVNPSTGKTPLNISVQIGPFACGAPSPAALDVEIPTDRTAGMVQGLFDVSGHAETTAEVRIGDLSWYYRTTPQPIPPGSVPTVPWKFQGVPEGSREVYAWAALEGGKSILEFPHLDSYNQRVSVVRLQTEDLGATFVAKPTVVRGNVVLVDPGGLTDLDGIQTHPLSELSGYEKSFMLAEGVDQRASNTPDCVNRSSGTKGRSLGRLTGAYDPAQHRADMSYELLLAGLSPRQASPEGIGACPAPWNMAGLSTSLITMTDPPHSGKCSFLLKLGQYFPLLADVNAEPVLFPDQKICFGKIKLDYHVNSSLGSIYYPYLYLRQSGVEVGPNVFGTAYSLGTGNAYGTPRLASESGPTASVTATLPEGLRYKIDPMIYFLPAGQTSGQGTYLYLDTIVLPETGFVGCGDVLSACLSLLDEQGNYSLLSIGFPSVTEYCLTGGDLILDFNVHLTDGGDVALVGYVLDPDNAETADLSDPNAVILCPSDCGPNPSYGLGLSGLSVGPHALKIIAVAANGCRAGRIYQFHVQSQPLTIQCSEDITVDLLPNETGISNDDPRIAGRLNAASSGGCGLPLTIGDDVPDHFPIGQTTVSFWIQGHEEISCKTTVTVAPADRILSFICRDPATGEQVIRKRTFRDDSLDTVTYSHPQPFHFEYGRDGSRMAVIPDGTGAVKIIDTATNTTASLFP